MIAYLYCAGCVPQNTESISTAIAAAKTLRMLWFLHNDAAGVGYHSTFHAQRLHGNVSIWIENDSEFQLIRDAMSFASERTRIEVLKELGRTM